MATAAMMHPPPLDGAREHDLTVPCGRIYAVELGEGPLVVLIHDFPEGWWPWRHQLPALGGGREPAIDVRGYGGSRQGRRVRARLDGHGVPVELVGRGERGHVVSLGTPHMGAPVPLSPVRCARCPRCPQRIAPPESARAELGPLKEPRRA